MENETVLKDIDMLITKKQYRKIPDMLEKTIEIEIARNQDIKKTVDFFNRLYDKLYYYIIFNKLDIDKPLVKQLESLAMPIRSRTEEEWKKIFRDIKKSKK